MSSRGQAKRNARKVWVWTRGPVLFPRWMLVTGYALYVALGVGAAFASIPSLRFQGASPDSVVVTAAVIILGASAAIYGAARDATYWLESLGAILLALALSAYSAAAIISAFPGGVLDLDRVVFAVAIFIISAMPGARGYSLVPRMIRGAVRHYEERRHAHR